MKLKTYSKYISELAAKYPDANVVYSTDDEGNSFTQVSFLPGAGNFNGHEFEPKLSNSESKVNAICLN